MFALRLRVAGRTLLVRSPIRLGLPAAYAAFRVSRGADLVMDVRPGVLPPLPGPLLFESGGTWTAHARRGGLVYAFRTRGPASSPDRLLFVNHALTRATLYVPPFRAGSARPLGYPLDDLFFQHHLARAGQLCVHACGIVIDGRAVLFSGMSGAGKTTTARLWSRRVRGARVLSDDRVVVDGPAGRLRAHGTPWHGEGRFALPESAMLAALFFLRHGARTRVAPLPVAATAARLFARTFPPAWDKAAVERTLAACARLAESVPAWELSFRPDASAIAVVRETLRAG